MDADTRKRELVFWYATDLVVARDGRIPIDREFWCRIMKRRKQLKNLLKLMAYDEKGIKEELAELDIDFYGVDLARYEFDPE